MADDIPLAEWSLEERPKHSIARNRYPEMRSDGATSPTWWRGPPEVAASSNPDESPTELAVLEGFDTGTEPPTPVYWKYELDEITGETTTVYSLDSDFSTEYTPLGTVIPSAGEQGVTTSSDSSPDSLVYLPTGDSITEVETVRDKRTGEFLYYTYHFFNTDTGEMSMTNNAQQVGQNQAPVLNQLIGEIKLEYFDPAAAITRTAFDLLDDAAADGLILRTYKADGTPFERPASSKTDWIAKVDFDLKPVWGGAGAVGETEGQATTSEASITDGVDEQNMDGGGSRTYGNLVSNANNFLIKPEFAVTGQMDVAAGSVMEVTLVVVSDPVPETTLV